MNEFLLLPLWKQFIALSLGIPLLLFLFVTVVYLTSRVISKAILASYLEHKLELIKRLFSGTKSQDNTTK